MTSPYRPETANGMTGSSVAHGFAGGTSVQEAIEGMDTKFQKPQPGHPTTGVKSSFPPPTHSYAGGAQGQHTVHAPRGL